MALKVYYAHAMGFYGSRREQLTRLELIGAGCEVMCPNDSAKHEAGFQAQGMSYFDEHFLPEIDVIAYEPYDDGMVGAGVAYEVKKAIEASKIVWRIDHLPHHAGGDPKPLLTSERQEFRLDELKILGRDVTRSRNWEIRGDRPLPDLQQMPIVA